jgi:hypothetical protein
MDDPKGEMQWPKIRLILLITGAALLLIPAVVYLPGIWRARNVQAAYHSYNKALVAKDYETAYNLLSEETRAAGSLEGFVQVQQAAIEKHGPLRGFEEGEMNARLEDQRLIAIHTTMIYEKDRVPYAVLLKKHMFVWEIWGVIEE